MYKSVLLPEILEFIQAFFPSLIEQSYEHCKSATSISLREVRSANQHLCNRFQRVLALPVTRPRPLPTNANFSGFENEVRKLTQVWSIAAQEEVLRKENPLAPEQVLAAIESSLQLSCLSDTEILCEEIEKQLELVGEGFYRKINSILAPCAEQVANSNDHTLINNGAFTATEPPTLSDAEKAIESVKRFFDSEITDEKIGTRFHALCKKMYIPAINCALMSPPSVDTPAIVLLLHKIQRVGQFWFHERPNDAVLIARAENTVRRFIKAAMQGHTDLSFALQAVNQILQEYHISEAINHQIPELPIPITTLDFDESETAVPDEQTAADAIEITWSNEPSADFDFETADQDPSSDEDGTKELLEAAPQTEAPINDIPRKVSLTVPSVRPKQNFPNIYKQAKHLIYTLLIDCSPNCLAHKLRKEWLRVLEAAGTTQGVNSRAWDQAVDLFLQLTEYSNVEDIPISLAYKAQAQLKFASLDGQFFDAKTQSLKVKTPAGAVISEGHWFNYIQDGKAIRCKLAAIIRQIGRFIFVSRQGQKVLELEKSALEKMLQEGSLQALGDVSVNSTIEDVLSNIKHVQAKELI